MIERLVGLMIAEWEDFDGWCIERRIDPLELNIDRLLNLIQWWATKDAEDPQKVKQWKDKLHRPPAGISKTQGRQPWTQDEEQSSFRALQQAVG